MLPAAQDLTYFLEVAKTLNFSRAAERLGVTQPSLSVAVQRLEHELGVKLFIRSKRGVQLTDSGLRLSRRVQELLESWGKVRSEAREMVEEVAGHFVIGCHTAVARYTLPLWLPTFLKQNPLLTFEFRHDLSRKITEQVISFQIDFGIVVNPTPHPDLVIKELLKDEVSLWIHYNGPVSEDVLIYDPSLLQSQSIVGKLKGLGHIRHMHTPSLEVTLALAESRAGIAILPGRVAAMAREKLKPFDKKSPMFHDRICLVYRADQPKTKARREIAGFIEKKIKGDA